MVRRLAEHPGLSFLALVAAMLAGSVSVSSTVEVAMVGTSWLGLDSPVGVCVAVACSILALVAIPFFLLAVLSGSEGDDDDDGHRGDDDEPPKPEGPAGDPDWWPGFEREFEAYLREPVRDPSGDKTPSIASASAR